jgi:uncharacterized repeat protein (TIGR01451 family)
MKTTERDRHDWMIIPMILVIGFLGVLIAGQWALRFSPRWQLDANMESNLDPNSDFLTGRPNGFIEPVDPSILTQPVWAGFFLTPGASSATKTPFTTTSIASPAATLASPTLPATPTTVLQVTSTSELTAIPTSTIVPLPWVPTPTSRPPHTNHPTETHTPTSTPTIVSTATATPTPTATPTDTPLPIADLQIIKNDGASTYVASGTLTYTLTVINAGPSGIVDAVVTDNIPAQVANWSWVCTSQTGGATGCDGMTGSANFSDTVQLPNGASIVYTAIASISAGASGDLTNVAAINLPAGFTDPAPGNNSAADTNQILIANSFPWGNIGETKDGIVTTVSPSGASITLAFSTPLSVGMGNYLVYYEMGVGTGMLMDQVQIEISDGYNWYPIFHWGAGGADTNSNLNTVVIGGSEDDNRDFSSTPASDVLYPFGSGTLGNPATGVTIQVDGVVPNGTYPYIRITAHSGDSGDGCDVDAIQILP